MNKKNLYVDIHVLQTVPPSCVNRDDTGSPKTAVYGGATRARVSSQSWKHAMRAMFSDIFEKEDVGTRTKRVVDMVASKILQHNPDFDEKKAGKLAAEALKLAGLKLKDNDTVTDALFFISDSQAEALAQLAVSEEKEKSLYKNPDTRIIVLSMGPEQAKNALKEFPAIDIALFGRMVASDPSLNYDAAAQVAHSISTHKIQNEYDFFTAVDDRAPEDNDGAGHLGTTEFNSSTL
jgi:CRISPR system Cascade subunit CasC